MAQDNSIKIMVVMMATCMALMLGVGVYVLRQEGEKTREAMKLELKEVALEAGQNVQQAAQDGIEKGVKDGFGQAQGAFEEATGALLGSLDKDIDGNQIDPAEMLGKLIPRTRRDEESESEDDTSAAKSDNKSTASKDRSNSLDPVKAVEGLFKFGSDVMRKADDAVQDPIGLSDEEEQDLGAAIHEEMEDSDDVEFSDDEDLKTRVEDAAQLFLDRLKRPEIKYTFSVIVDEDVNAASLPGGYIYVNTGLLDFVKSDEELEFVIGHEIAHVDLEHCVRSYTYAHRAGNFDGGLMNPVIMGLYDQYAVGFSRSMENEADDYALKRMLDAGRSEKGPIEFNERLAEKYEQDGVPTQPERPKNVPEAIAYGLESHFRTHPPTRQRIDRLRRTAKNHKKSDE
ncbi:MAG: M48 family metalloprotease [Planctomycetaceae bacterium]|nr:M48 family metalloprotease [Planctomycetaceae bacterium]